MKIASIIIGIITGLMLLSTLICGLWIRANKITDVSSLDFHMKIGSSSVVLGIITVIILLSQLLRK